jgi:hypothetical protein
LEAITTNHLKNKNKNPLRWDAIMGSRDETIYIYIYILIIGIRFTPLPTSTRDE